MSTSPGAQPEQPPIIVGATGGSGTRIIAAALRDAGFFIGTNLNPPNDALEFVEFYNRWNDRFWVSPEKPLTTEERREMESDFRQRLARQLKDLPSPGTPWAWKNPRSIYLLPFWNELFPEMRFVHVVRDGRDMAFSSNQNQLKHHGETVLGKAAAEWPKPLRAAELWNRVNMRAHEFARERLGDRYLLIRFEDLCAEPGATIRKLWSFAGVSSTADASASAGMVKPPESLGRWRNCEDSELLEKVTSAVLPGLRTFGYIPGST